MHAKEWENRLSDLPVHLRYFDTIGSTNDEALNWAANGADEYALVVADHQSHGRGRLQRNWVTQAGSALAFSLALYPSAQEAEKITLFSPLAAMALCETLKQHGAAPESCKIKWPNDVLIHGKKAAGILVESTWLGERIANVIIGMGVNIHHESVPAAEKLLFPATCLDTELYRTFDRIEILHDIIEQIIHLRKGLTDPGFIEKYESLLAYKGETVHIQKDQRTQLRGVVAGIFPNGDLKVQQPDGHFTAVTVGDVQLRLA